MNKKTEVKHTPTPWIATQNYIAGPKEMMIADFFVGLLLTHEEQKANQLFAVRAVNSHEALVNFIYQLLDDEILLCVAPEGCYHCDAEKLIIQAEGRK